MRRTTHKATAIETRRRGLAPLELVMALPIMLFAMALMVNIGTVGAWKVREQANVRNAAWRSFHLRSGNVSPNPPMWPTNAQISDGSGADAADTDQIWNTHPDLTTPSTRGDVVAEPTQGMSFVVNRMLDIDVDVHDGRAPLERQIPMLRGILPNNGRYNLDLQQNVLDGNWEYHNLRRADNQGFSRNLDRRAKVMYEIDPNDFPSSAALEAIAQRSLAEIWNPANYTGTASWEALAPLDVDGDLDRLSRLPPRSDTGRPPSPDGTTYEPVGGAPDLYPGRRVIQACLADPSALRTNRRFTDYMEQIQRLPGSVARTFRQWHQDRLDYLQGLDPPLDGSDAEITQLEDEIDLLNQFIGALPPQHR